MVHSVIDCKAPLYKKISHSLPKILERKKCMKLSILMSEKEKEGYIDMIVNGKFLLARVQ